ncbi:death-associated protein 1-like [Ylistrum balloti]|uniref:death-associated protein 1-like n=1 Tax=Ylistrum balloti TaxID=509963 RepID=UPI002905D349|nr:death-associated protein 1-like [Ylistrum balloti]
MSAAEGADLKGGHPPAVKVGGMRVVQHKDGKDKPAEQLTKEEKEEYGSSPPKSDTHHQSVLVGGTVTQGDKDFPPEAVKHYHNKPLPTHEHSRQPAKNFNIQQPR